MLRKFLPIIISAGLLIVLGGVVFFLKLVDGSDFSFMWDRGASEEEVSVKMEKESDPLRRKLNEIIIKELSFKDTTLEEALKSVRIRARKSDQASVPSRRGISSVVRSPRNTGGGLIKSGDGLGGDESMNPVQRITLEAREIGVADALDLICEKTGYKWRIDEYAILVIPKAQEWPADNHKEVVGRKSKAVVWIEKKLSEIVVGPFDLRDATLDEIVEFLRIQSKENDPGPSGNSGFSFIVRGSAKLLTLKTGKVSLHDALDLVCEAADCRWHIDPKYLKIVIQPKSMEHPPSEPIWANPSDPLFEGSDDDVAPGDDPFGG